MKKAKQHNILRGGFINVCGILMTFSYFWNKPQTLLFHCGKIFFVMCLWDGLSTIENWDSLDLELNIKIRPFEITGLDTNRWAERIGSISNMRTTTYTIHKEPVGLIRLKDFKNVHFLCFVAQNRGKYDTLLQQRCKWGGKITTLLSYQAVTNPVIACHIPIIITTGKPLTPDLERQRERKADPAWSHHSRWICQICLLGLMEMLSGKYNDLCVHVWICVCLCVHAYPPPPPIHSSSCPASVWGKLSHFAATERQGRASFGLRPGSGNFGKSEEEKNK